MSILGKEVEKEEEGKSTPNSVGLKTTKESGFVVRSRYAIQKLGGLKITHINQSNYKTWNLSPYFMAGKLRQGESVNCPSPSIVEHGPSTSVKHPIIPVM